MNKICINASNLHFGGGIQVATSFISALSELDSPEIQAMAVDASTEVNSNLIELGVDITRFNKYVVANTFGLKTIFSSISNEILDYDIVFTVFGPFYSFYYNNINIVGFAQPWIINSEVKNYSIYKPIERAIIYLKYLIQWIFFKNSDAIVVEADFIKMALHQQKKFPLERLFSVSNTISNVFLSPDKQTKISVPRTNGFIRLGLISRDYPHKNLNILPYVGIALKRSYNFNVRFFVTLSDNEWRSKSEIFKEYCQNIGPLNISQCPNFYRQMDGTIFPSLLECFSATPLEALAMESPLFASNRPFVTETCKEYAHYFDPLNPQDIASVIYKYFTDTGEKQKLLKDARNYVLSLPNAIDRAKSYLKIIKKFTQDYRNV